MKAMYFFVLVLLVNAVFSQESRTDKWQNDLAFYQKELQKRHIDVYHKIDKQSFENELNLIYSTVENRTDWEIVVELMRLTRKIGDGHTSVSLANWETHYFPIEVKKISDQWRVVKVSEEYASVLGATLTKIDGKPIREIEQELSAVAQFVENEHSEVVRIGENLPLSELLYAMRITKRTDEAQFQFVTDAGKKLNLVLKPLSQSELKSQNYKELKIGVPGIEKPDIPDFDFLWFTQVEGTAITYIRFDSYPSFEEMMPFAEKLVGFIMQSQSRQVIIDLRNNGGGDLYIGLIMANALNMVDGIDWKNGVYILSGCITFSAGASNVALFRELLNAKIVGMPTGSNPTGYQDMDAFDLPYSTLRITYSKRLFRIQETATEGVQPDFFIDYSWDSYANGVDNVLSELLSILKQ
ncbi:MAG TPA: S41 family peptidase [Bacteroidales bacterium]|nr:S41 family peptidase [Bacteroidales bacterium]